ncbi:hypothetical protein MLD38_018260 [Melastoma candidum]|uniref:Uncharacterized protein n=1 Tax=Melastoma candidum TaxID=119954 RepID=A0ACB9R1I6_9MYRT|nr:hypothetical protein MLD38_018260 [Melastoma candidum]
MANPSVSSLLVPSSSSQRPLGDFNGLARQLLFGGRVQNGEPAAVADGSSSAHERSVGDGSVEDVGENKESVGKTRKTTRPKIAFQTRSADDVLDDGYRWRKYGQKAVKNSAYPRCTIDIDQIPSVV